MADLVILRDGTEVGKVAEEGFFTANDELRTLLKRIFDGEGAMNFVGVETDEGIIEGFEFVKPDADGFYEVFKDDLYRSGFQLAVK